ncbi:phosphotransferase [Actinoplanes sp. ATCC 53533]|uniref:phosphotransferase n=1 Tax=Actinoplanes sp. ATCC 53533 TaxID=1288362 RepID=UPI0018F42B8C|nr:phosphotransferase [Actinoplanes sp. ATCC 53533]
MIFRRTLPLGVVLRDRLGRPRRVRSLVSSPRSRVWRAEFAGTPTVVKQIVGGPDAVDRFDRELLALRLAGAGRPRVVPEVLAADRDHRVLVLEHLAAVPDDGPWAIRYATALARLHALSPGDLPADTGPGAPDIRAFLALARALGVPVPAGAEDELSALLGRLRAAGSAQLLHGDPCPGNEISTAGGIRFVDLEGAAAGAGLSELAYLRIGFPTCWCVRSTPAPVLLAAERAYRDTWRSLRGGDPPGDLADACLGWVVQGDALVERAERRGTDHFARMLRADWQWGTMTARERVIHRLGVAAAAADGRADLAATVRLAAAMREALARA